MPNLAITCRATVAAAFTLFAAGAAVADQEQSQLGLASKLHTLVHQTAASACMINTGVAVEAETQSLLEAHQSFNKVLATLADSGLRDQTTRIEASWRPIDVAISMIIVGENPANYIPTIQNGKSILEVATLSLLDQTSSNYEHSDGVTTSDVLTVDLAERQEVFVQMMKLMACEMADDAAGTEIKTALQDTIKLYDVTLDALTNGRPDMGIAAPDNYAVNQVLAASAFDWQGMKPVLETIVENGRATTDDLTGLRARTAALDTRMATLIDIYLAPAGGDVVPQVAELGQATE